MIQKKGLKVGDRGTIKDFKEIFTLEHLGKNGFYYVNRNTAKLVTKDGTTPIDSDDSITFLGHGLWHVEKKKED